MTHDEMATELRNAGWLVQPPLTQENCPHPNQRGNISMGYDGSGSSDMYCPDCGKVSKSSWPARPDFNILSVLPQNALGPYTIQGTQGRAA